jgi:hypothetical protein
MSTAYDKHVEKALATLEDLSARELEATAAKLVNRRDGWREFGLFFSAPADERRGHRRTARSLSSGRHGGRHATSIPGIDGTPDPRNHAGFA